MICFPNAKINLGLHIINKRTDGYHNIETILFPINLSDILEFTESSTLQLNITGRDFRENIEQNTVYQAYQIIKNDYDIPPVKIHLHKIIPSGAGLGGGSSDGAYMLSALNDYYDLGLTSEQLKQYAGQIGKDSVFFIDNTPAYATETGDKLDPVPYVLYNFYIAVIHPGIHINTADAYNEIKPAAPDFSLKDIIKNRIDTWATYIGNDFEKYVLKKYPRIKDIKSNLYKNGALFAALTGSGSAVYGIFYFPPQLHDQFSEYFYREGRIYPEEPR